MQEEQPKHALSLRQPWAELILQGRKTIETRKWATKFKGPFYIHAAKTLDLEACKRFNIDPKTLTTGALVGIANCTGTTKYESDSHFMSEEEKHLSPLYHHEKPKFGFNLCGVKRINPIPAKGMLNFFKIDEQTLAQQQPNTNN